MSENLKGLYSDIIGQLKGNPGFDQKQLLPILRGLVGAKARNKKRGNGLSTEENAFYQSVISNPPSAVSEATTSAVSEATTAPPPAPRTRRTTRKAATPPAYNENAALAAAMAASLSMTNKPGEPGLLTKAKAKVSEAFKPASPSYAPNVAAMRMAAVPLPPGEDAAPTDWFKIVEGRTLDDGNCFYSSVFRAAKERGLLPRFQETLGLNIDSEMKFITGFRTLVGAEIREGHLPSEGAGDTFDRLVELSQIDEEGATLAAALEHYPQWFQDAFGDVAYFLVPNREKFLIDFAKGAEEDGNWVSELEVTIVRRLLEAASRIRIISRNIKTPFAPKKEGDFDLLHILNKGDAHFVHMSFKEQQLTKADIEKMKENHTECLKKCAEIGDFLGYIEGVKRVRGGGKTVSRKAKARSKRGTRKH